LRDIEHKKYDPAQFIDELKQQVTDIVRQVIADQSNRRVTIIETPTKPIKPIKPTKPTKPTKPIKPTPPTPSDPLVGQPCPLCGKGHIIKGRTAYGCSEWKSGCAWRQPFV
ncbi:MAG: DNA topoisomerase III, partial [Prevotella sp.]|nr:DNA topoisomerase III [Prevotella sp.]